MDVTRIRQDFPTLKNSDKVYLDSACQSLKPYPVIESMTRYYEEFPACGGRSVHSMATKVSMEIDDAREKTALFFGSKRPSNFVFTKNCTESINIVAKGLGLKKGDVVVTGDSEHNSNHIPWLDLQETVGIKRRFAASETDGEFNMENFKDIMGKDVKLVSITQSSNVTGHTVPVKEVAEIAHDHGAMVLVDGAQAAPHMPVDVVDMDVDFYAVSAHKMLGPTGVGILYGKEEALLKLRPLICGGGIVGLATYDSMKLSPPPERFEAGLQNYAGIIGTAAALDYLKDVGLKEIAKHELTLQRIMLKETEDLDIKMVGSSDPEKRSGLFSFNLGTLESHDVAVMIDSMGIMIRSGMHCAHPFFVSRGIPGCARASVYLYNTGSEVMRFAESLRKIHDIFAKC